MIHKSIEEEYFANLCYLVAFLSLQETPCIATRYKPTSLPPPKGASAVW